MNEAKSRAINTSRREITIISNIRLANLMSLSIDGLINMAATRVCFNGYFEK